MTSTIAPEQAKNSGLSFASEEIGPLMNYLLLPLMMSLLFLQAVREFIGQIYFQNLGAMSLGPSVLLIFMLLSPIVVILLRKIRVENLLILTATAVLLFRFIMPFVQEISSLYMIITGLAVAFFGMYLPVAFSVKLEEMPDSLPSGPVLFSIGFCLAVAIDITLRTIGVTWDPSIGPFGLFIAPIFCVITGLILYKSYTSRNTFSSDMVSISTTSKIKAAALGLSFGGVMFAILSFLAYPNVVARWTASSYEIAVVSSLIGLIIYAMMSVYSRLEYLLIRREFILVVNFLSLLTAFDLAYLLSPFAGLLAGVSIFAFMLDLRMLWGYLKSHNASLTDYAIFYFMGMLILLLLTLFYVLTLVAGMILPSLEGLSPYLILISFVLAVLSPLILGISKKEVVA
jgi:hypothetical protein